MPRRAEVAARDAEAQPLIYSVNGDGAHAHDDSYQQQQQQQQQQQYGVDAGGEDDRDDERGTLLAQQKGAAAGAAQAPAHGQYGSFATYSMTVNFIMGVGVLSLPFAFYKTGLILSSVFVMIITLLSFITVMSILNASARAEALAEFHRAGNKDAHMVEFVIRDHRHDIRSLAARFLGRWGWHYDIALILFTYGALWSYTTVFASALTANVRFPSFDYPANTQCDIYGFFPQACEDTYLIFVAIWAAVVIPLSMLNMSEQKPVQIALTFFRFFAVTVMIVTVCVGFYYAPYQADPPVPAHPPYVQPVSLGDFSGFAAIFGSAVFAQMVHPGVPNIAQPMINKRRLPLVFTAAFGTTLVAYTLLGVLCSLYFGSAVRQTVSINWLTLASGPTVPQPTWAVAAKWIILMFPAVDVISAFPLVTISLASNLQSAIPERFQPVTVRGKRIMHVLVRLVAALPPILGGMAVKDLSVIVTVSGMFGYFVAFITPGLLEIFSRRMCMRELGRCESPYVPWVGKNYLGVGSIIVGIVALVASITISVYAAVHPAA